MSGAQATGSSGSWVDAIFGGLRAASRELEASQAWLVRADETKKAGAWRATFVLAARAKWEAARRALAEVEGQLGTSGMVRAGDAMAPLDQLHENIAAMRTRIQEHEKALATAFAALAGAPHRGSA